MTDTEQLVEKSIEIEKIDERVAMHRKFPHSPAIFKYKNRLSPDLSNIKSRKTALNGVTKVPVTVELDFDNGSTDSKGEPDGLKRHRLMYNKGDDIFKGWERFKDKNGMFEVPKGLDEIVFTGDTLVIYGQSVANLNLIKYLSYIEKFYEATHGFDMIGYEEFTPADGVDESELVEEMIETINKLGSSSKGMEFLVRQAKDEKINKQFALIDALLSKDNGGKELLKMFKGRAINEKADFKKVFLPYNEEKTLVKAAMKGGILGYNPTNSAYQLKDKNEYLENEIIFTIKEKHDVVAHILFFEYLSKNKEAREKIKLMLSAKK